LSDVLCVWLYLYKKKTAAVVESVDCQDYFSNKVFVWAVNCRPYDIHLAAVIIKPLHTMCRSAKDFMHKKILILTAQKPGVGGHRSSSNAIKTALLQLDPNLDVNDYDSNLLFRGYKYGGEEKYYSSFTTRYRVFWKIFFEISSFFKGISNFILYKAIHHNLRKLILEYKPDMILSVHPCFVGSVNKTIKKMKLDIPLYACIIDLVKHSRLWHDKKCKITFVPTVKMYKLLFKKGFKADKLVHSGFPINEKFSNAARQAKAEIIVPNVLMVSPSQKGNKYILKLVQAALKHKINLTVITASNKKLRKYLEEKLAGQTNIEILGYINDMDERLYNADVLIAKAGPNMILEGVKACVPVLITGNILGQEEKNHEYIEENGYGFRCKTPKKLTKALGQLFENNYELLKQFSFNANGCLDISGGKVVAEKLFEELEERD